MADPPRYLAPDNYETGTFLWTNFCTISKNAWLIIAPGLNRLSQASYALTRQSRSFWGLNWR